MPTGYTAEIADGTVTDFRTFALRCARQFGACIMQRDDPMRDEPKHREPSDYHRKALAQAEADLAELQAMTVEEAGRRADAEHTNAVREHERYERNQRETRARYDAMLANVQRWTPPTSDHAALKRFMISQLEESRKLDTDWHSNAPKHQSGADWLTARRARASHDVGYHAGEWAEEQSRCAQANAWIDALYGSLTADGASPGGA